MPSTIEKEAAYSSGQVEEEEAMLGVQKLVGRSGHANLPNPGKESVPIWSCSLIPSCANHSEVIKPNSKGLTRIPDRIYPR